MVGHKRLSRLFSANVSVDYVLFCSGGWNFVSDDSSSFLSRMLNNEISIVSERFFAFEYHSVAFSMIYTF